MSVEFVATEKRNPYTSFCDVFTGSTNFASLYPATIGENHIQVVLVTRPSDFHVSPPVTCECAAVYVHKAMLGDTLNKLSMLYPPF